MSELLGKPSLGQRHLIMSTIEQFNYPNGIDPVYDTGWIPFKIEDKSIVCPFDVNGNIFFVRFYVYNKCEQIDKGFLPMELVEVCYQIQEQYQFILSVEKAKIADEKKKAKEIK